MRNKIMERMSGASNEPFRRGEIKVRSVSRHLMERKGKVFLEGEWENSHAEDALYFEYIWDV